MARKARKVRKVSRLERRRALWKEAMPEVKKLVRRFDRGAIAHCLKVMADQDAVARRIAALKKEAAELQKKL